MRQAYIVNGVRTPIGRYGGSLSQVRTDDLGAHAVRELMKLNPGVPATAIDDVIFGCANQAGEDNRNVARMALLLAGLPADVPGMTVNRLCGSGLEAVGQAARAIKSGEAELMIAGGVESMSRAPFVMGKATEAFSRTQNELYDTTIGWRFVNPLLKKQYGVNSMPETAENVAQDFQICREAQDKFAYNSQMRASRAQKNGRFAKEIVPVSIPQRKGDPIVVSKDEHPRETTMEQLAKLGTPFRKEGGSVTAGNASGVNDGAAALLIASEEAVKRYNLKPIARILGHDLGRRAAAHHGHRPGAGVEEARREAWPFDRGFRRDRAQRSVRRAGPRGDAPARPPRRRRARQSQRRRHRARPSARHVGRAHRAVGGDRIARAAAPSAPCARCASASVRASRWRWSGCEGIFRVGPHRCSTRQCINAIWWLPGAVMSTRWAVRMALPIGVGMVIR